MQLQDKSPRLAQVAEENSLRPDYGLRREILSPLETLAQSVSTIAPTTTPAATIPLVCALAGNGTWLAYALATAAVLLVGLCISRYARLSASPGSLYTYASMTLPPWLSATVAWSLLLAYVATGSSVIGGFYHYANLLLRDATGHAYSTVALATLVTGNINLDRLSRHQDLGAPHAVDRGCIGHRDRDRRRALLVRHGWHVDAEQLHLHGMTGSGLRLGLVLALFSFVGFESATTLGSEARNPLQTIPRAVIQSALLAGVFFTVCAYAEVLGFHSRARIWVQARPHVCSRPGWRCPRARST
jgi:amino acid transporter